MVKINGESLEIAGRTIAQYIATTSYDIRRIAIECNGEIVPKAVYAVSYTHLTLPTILRV